MIDPRVEPRRFSTDEAGRVVVDVPPVVRNRLGAIVTDQMVQHVYVIDDGLVRRMEIRKPWPAGGDMTIIRIYTGPNGRSHFEDIEPRFKPLGDQSESAELIPGSGIVVRRFAATRTNPWHQAPAYAAVFTLSGAVDIEIGDAARRATF